MQQFSIQDISSPFFPEHLQKYSAGEFSRFTHFSPDLSSITDYAVSKQFDQDKRTLLIKVLQQQYQVISGAYQAVKNNIIALSGPSSFTFTTGQQIHILGGPIFFMTKIMDCIALTKQMNEIDDGKTYIPIFWLASEDHDLDEINYVDVYGERYMWDTKNSGGPVGRYKTDGLVELIEKIRERLDDTEENVKFLNLREQAYTMFPNLSQATHRALDQLFGEEGLIVIDADDAQLKSLFVQTMHEDLTTDRSFAALTRQTALLEKTSVKAQAIPKEINLFYMTDKQRSRILSEDMSEGGSKREEKFSYVLDLKIKNHDELDKELTEHPERFSPNVFLRPLYQETILPNLVYLAGPGEIKYWLQMKQLFTVYDLQMPVLLPRQLTQYLPEKHWGSIKDSNIPLEEWFLSYDNFLTRLKKEKTDEFTLLDKVMKDRKASVSDLEKELEIRKTIEKNISKSIHNIRSELETLERRLEALQNQSLEDTPIVGKLLKLHKRSFNASKRFEREQFVVGNVNLWEKIKKCERRYEEGVKVVVY